MLVPTSPSLVRLHGRKCEQDTVMKVTNCSEIRASSHIFANTC